MLTRIVVLFFQFKIIFGFLYSNLSVFLSYVLSFCTLLYLFDMLILWLLPMKLTFNISFAKSKSVWTSDNSTTIYIYMYMQIVLIFFKILMYIW